MKLGQNFQNQHRRHPEDSFEPFGFCLGLIPFLESVPPISSFFCHFFDYVITTHTYGHDVIGHSDIWNESSRVDQQGTEVRFTLPGTDKKLWPLRYALISYFGLMLRISTVGNTLNGWEWPKLSKFFTFGSTFESCWINLSISFTC